MDDPNEPDSAEARRILSDRIEAGRRPGNGADPGDALARLGQLERNEGNTDAAIALYREAADVARSEGAPLRLAHRLRHIGDIYREAGDAERAGLYYGEALTLYRADPEPPGLDLANLLRPLALLREAQNLPGAARQFWTEAHALYDRAGVSAGVDECTRHIEAIGAP
jgi:tetratricopeptide (TPR) repeat protein